MLGVGVHDCTAVGSTDKNRQRESIDLEATQRLAKSLACIASTRTLGVVSPFSSPFGLPLRGQQRERSLRTRLFPHSIGGAGNGGHYFMNSFRPAANKPSG